MANRNVGVSQFDNKAYLEQVTAQVRRATTELVKLEQLLQAGMVDYAVLVEFRKAVDQIRTTSWAVQKTLQPDDAEKS